MRTPQDHLRQLGDKHAISKMESHLRDSPDVVDREITRVIPVVLRLVVRNAPCHNRVADGQVDKKRDPREH